MIRITLLVAILTGVALAGVPDPNQCDLPGETPDVIVGDLPTLARLGRLGDHLAFSVAVTPCNIGSCWLNFFATSEQHPAFGLNLFRLADGRFEQIGQSWLFHQFLALSSNGCSTACVPTSGTHLGVLCSTTDSAAITGTQAYMGPRSDVDAATASFDFPQTTQGMTGNVLYKRLQVHDDDLDPALHPDALYVAEGFLIAADDAAARNQFNNHSYREALVVDGGGEPTLVFSAPTVQEQPGLHAWAEADPLVAIRNLDVPGDGRFVVASRATPRGGGVWNYEYALYNFNSSRAAGAVRIPVPSGVVIDAIGFHDVDYHSGDPFSGDDWPAVVDQGAVTWSTESFAVNPEANALRWGTLYNFRFDAAVPPVASGEMQVDLFRPGGLTQISVEVIAPRVCDGDGQCEASENCYSCPGDCEQVGVDSDTDAFATCADCDDGDQTVWAPPGEARELTLHRQGVETMLSWNQPLDIGSVSVAYHAIRSADPSDFVTGGSCLIMDDAMAQSTAESEDLLPGELRAYLIRAVNQCPDGLGPLGNGRLGPGC